VLVHLTSSLGTNIESRLLTELWREAAHKFEDIKFCEMRGDLCIEGYPEKNCPTILVYHNGDILRQIITLRQFHGQQTSIEGQFSQFVVIIMSIFSQKTNFFSSPLCCLQIIRYITRGKWGKKTPIARSTYDKILSC
jgi:hypothetical protein